MKAFLVPSTLLDERVRLERVVQRLVERLVLLLGEAVGRVDRHRQTGEARGPAFADHLRRDRGFRFDRQRVRTALEVGQEDLEVVDERGDLLLVARAQTGVDVQEADVQLVQHLVGLGRLGGIGRRLRRDGLLCLGGIGAHGIGLLGCGVHVVPLVGGSSD